MISKDTEFAAIKLPRCPRGGRAKVEWGGHCAQNKTCLVQFEETVAPSTRELTGRLVFSPPLGLDLHRQRRDNPKLVIMCVCCFVLLTRGRGRLETRPPVALVCLFVFLLELNPKNYIPPPMLPWDLLH